MTGPQAVHLAAGVVALLGTTVLVLSLAGVRVGSAPVTAVARGTLQLALVALVLRGALTRWWAVPLVLLVMLAVAAATATRRLRSAPGAGRAVAVACLSGSGVALGIVFAVGSLPLQARYLVALGGIVIGATMTGATLAGRRLRDGLVSRREEIEAWLSLGAPPRTAVLAVARSAVRETLVPALDQTRSTGLVTLPGAFIGALLGGASPVQAARFQIVVLAAILCAQAVTAVSLTRALGAPDVLPAADHDR